jgi:ferrous iron transport protein B
MELKTNPKIALIGNLNCGKSSLFNQLTGLSQKTGNYPGTTVDKKTGYCKLDDYITADIIDLPGTDTIYPENEEDKVVFNILNNPESPYYPDIAVVVANATRLKESLLLLSQVKDLGIPIVLALNMVDLAEKCGIKIDPEILRSKLNIQVVKIHARKGEGIDGLKYKLSNPIVKECNPLNDVTSYSPELIEITKEKFKLCNSYKAFQKIIGVNYEVGLSEEEKTELKELKDNYNFNDDVLIKKDLEDRDELIKKMLSTFLKRRIVIKNALTEKMDKVLTHSVLGYIIFIGFLFMFSVGIFALSAFPAKYLGLGLEKALAFATAGLEGQLYVNEFLNMIFPWLKSAFCLLPHLLIFFVIISLLEESGYMARVVLLMDNATKKSGISGKCLIPFFSGSQECLLHNLGFIKGKQGMLGTFFRSLFSCSFQLPVHIILIGMFVPDVMLGNVNLKGLVLFTSLILSFTIVLFIIIVTNYFKVRSVERENNEQEIKTKNLPAVLSKGLNIELPNYSLPKLDNLTVLTLNNFKVFTIESGKVLFWTFAAGFIIVMIFGKVFGI